MTETYCGKVCAECAYKEMLSCSGCKSGPGRQNDGDCDLAKCCTEKGHRDCSTCTFGEKCNILRGKVHMPEYRIKSIEAERIRKAAIAQRAAVLGKWLPLLFWLFIPSAVGALLTSVGGVFSVPAISVSGIVLGMVCAIVQGVIFIRLGTEEERFRTAGIYWLLNIGISALITFVPWIRGNIRWLLLLAVVMLVIALVVEYNGFAAYSAVLTGVDNRMSEQWTVLWKWYIGACGVTCFNMLLVVLFFAHNWGVLMFLGMLMSGISSAAFTVTGVLKLIYQCKSAYIVKNYIKQTDDLISPNSVERKMEI